MEQLIFYSEEQKTISTSVSLSTQQHVRCVLISLTERQQSVGLGIRSVEIAEKNKKHILYIVYRICFDE